MNIKTITLQERGLRGMKVTYNEPEKSNNKIMTSDTNKTKRHPIHLGLEIPFKDLRFHLLQIHGRINDGMTKHDMDCVIEQCEVTAVEFNPEYFVIKGTLGCFADKEVELKTPKVDAGDEYEHFDTVINILKKIIEETKLYLAGDVKLDDTELVFRWIGAGKEKGVDMDSFNAMSEEEQKEFCQNILETNFGATIFMPEDLGIGEADEEKVEAIESFVLDPQKETVILPAK
jgi:hypothetical protein